MKALYINDKGRGPGHGFLHISDSALMPDLEGIRFAIKRGSDQSCLGKSGWQAADTFLDPKAIYLIDEGLAMALGPDVVDHLDPRESYRLTMLSADGMSVVGPLDVPEVAYSLQGAVRAAEEAPPPVEIEPEPEPEPEPELEPEPEPVPLPEPPVLAPPAPRKSAFSPLVLVLLLVVLGGAAFGLWKYLEQQKDSSRPGSAAQTEPQPGQPSPSGGPGSVPAAPAPEKAPNGGKQHASSAEAEKARPALARAREHLAGTADPKASLDLSRQLHSQEGGADAAFLLAEDAAQKGQADAMLLTGAFYDPTDTAPSGSIIKDPAQALSWYKKARAAGLAQADQRLASLRAWAEAEAAKGSSEAKDLLTRF